MSNKFKSFLILSLMVGSIFFVAPHALAAVDLGTSTIDNSIALSNTSPITIATNVINILMGLLSLLAICLILWGGFTYMTSGGSEDKIETAKKIIRNGAIGLVIILSAWGITYFILTKLVNGTGGSTTGPDNCTNGANTSCGCGGAQICNSGTWGPCLGSTCNPIIDNKTSCDGKAEVAECQADNTLCGSDYTCDTTDCLCKPKASLGDSCNANISGGKCTADDNLCGPYLKCDTSSCVCVGPPVITGISPAGGYCANDKNQSCNLDSDCLGGAKCDASTPNGAANNFITIYGYNFGTSSNIFESFLTNIDFEKGAIGAVPNDWTTATQKHSSVGIVNDQFKSGKQSVRIHQDPNQDFPGVCNKTTCDDIAGCVWKAIGSTCNFPGTDDAHRGGPAVYNQGETLVWGNSHNVMWSKLTYNLAPLNFKIGDTYSIQFYYKGNTAASAAVQVASNLGWTNMCVGYDYYAALKPGYTWNGSQISPVPPAGEDPCAPGFGKTCADQANTCCVNAPYQTKCYGALSLTSIPSGTVSDWTLYSYTFQYTPEMDTWLDSTGKKAIELGVSIGYNSTGAGTDLYIDDFTVTKVLNTGQVTFLGASAAQSQLANFPKLLNPNCISSWTDRQITIAVPSGAATGPIQVKREGNSTDNTDVTNNDVGPKINDFIKNDIYRPGLCQISPTQGLLGAKVDYQGINLKNSIAYFGEYTSAYKGINSTFAADNLSGQTLAPSIVPGQTTTFVERASTGVSQKSNALIFIKEKEAAAGPYISSFYPTTGAAGQYVTILGSGFGNMRGSRQVIFGDKEASYSFPEVCANTVWSDDQVVVKVPDGLSSNDYQIKMNLGDTTINTDLLSPNNTFKFDPSEILKTSLCKIDPARGQIGDKVNLWGEYFGNSGTDALVVFNRGIGTSSKIIKDGLADKIETVVPVGDANVPAITGPVHVMKNGAWGNELNFTIGKCASNDECNASSPVCCPANTYKTGSCSASLLSCYFEVPNSVYETKFNTTLSGSTTVAPFDSCIGMAAFYGTCQTGQFCPNSPGKCSPFSPSQATVTSDCGSKTSECGALDACKDSAAACTYNKTKDVCQTKQCQLEKEINYSLSGSTTSYKGSLSCRAYNDKTNNKTYFVKELKVTTSCPDNYISVGDGYCVNAIPVLCDPCPTNFKCIDNGAGNDLGTCESEKICESGATCGINPTDATKYSCLKTGQAKCDCCCEIGQDTRDCCAPLKCAGTCGSDTTDNGVGYGSCSGCTAAGSTQAQQDAACNCSTSTGKICDTSKPGGICVDCAALDETGCSAHAEQCCFDSAKKVCQGGNGTILPGGKCAYYDCGVFDTNGLFDKTQCNQTAATTGQFLATSTCITNCAKDPKTACDLAGADATKCSLQANCCFDAKNKKCTDGNDKISLLGINYCSYYNCNSSLGAYTCGAASTTGEILGLTACQKNCKPNTTLPGLTCASEAVGTCNTNFCGNPYSCLADSGSGPSTTECGTCCCKPGTVNGNLTCLPDKGACSGASRGLFCGCSSDTECGQDSQGCGSDTCCYGRPLVDKTSPVNNDQNVCRNRQIEVDFNQEMNATTLADNILLVEEKTYGTDTCPSGTTLAFNNFKPKTTNFLARLYQAVIGNFKHLFSGEVNNAIAAGPSPDKLYCVSQVTVEAKTGYVNGATSTIAYIQPQKVLSAKTNYFVIIKGDENLDSNSGVISLEKVGLNGSTPVNINHIVNPEFNGVTFKNSYTFGFTTMSDAGGKNGLCTISNVVVKPSSFLIRTANNDTSDDVPGDDAFDTKNDNDRAISALAYSGDNQLLQPVSGYNWNWNWKIDDTSVVNNQNITGLKSNQIVVAGVKGVTDKSTKIIAAVDMSGFSNVTFVGDTLNGVSDVYVFLCANPWPMEINGIWNPWVDKCTDSFGNQISGCVNYNYKFYYCRDAGVAGTADDLPAVTDPALILGSSGNLICSTDGSACNIQNAACGNSGTCIWNVLKESYFFREAIPQSGEITEIKSTGAGGQVAIIWNTPISSSAPVTAFKIYYGPSAGLTSSAIISLNLTEASCKVENNENHCSYLISKLTDGQKYYFKVSALTDKKAESPLSGSQEVIPTDTTAPAQPNFYSDANVPRVMFWAGKVNQHWDLAKGVWLTDSDGTSGSGIDKLTYCKKFYPNTTSVTSYKTETINTWKSGGNQGNYTNSIMSYRCVSSVDISPITLANGKIIIKWQANTDDTLYYRLFHGIFAGKKAADSVDSPNNATSLTLDQTNYRVGDNFFFLAAIDKSGNISATSEEVKVTLPTR